MTAMTRSKKLDELVGSVEDLLARLPNDVTPEIADLRDKVDAGIFEAWTSIAREVADTRGRAALSARAGSGPSLEPLSSQLRPAFWLTGQRASLRGYRDFFVFGNQQLDVFFPSSHGHAIFSCGLRGIMVLNGSRAPSPATPPFVGCI